MKIIKKKRIIDAHCHLGIGRYKKLDSKTLLESMDECEIQKSIIVPVEEYITVNNEEGNESILNAVQENKGRLIGFLTVNPWYGSKAVAISKKYIERGLKGIKLNPSLQGFLLNDDIVHEIIKVAAEHKVPVYFHTGTPIHSLPFQLHDLASNFPEVNFIMGHMGGSDFWNDVVPATKDLKNVYLETSLGETDIIEMAIQEIGAEMIIFGSDMPRSTQKHELEKITTICKKEEDLAKILYRNILSLLE